MKNVLASMFVVCCALAAVAQVVQPSEPPTTTADAVMAKVFVRDRQREKISQGYAGHRLYVFDNEKWHKHAELLVSVKGDPDGTKHFEVLNEEGWKSANKRVLRKMLESETETSRPEMRPKTLLTPENYAFSLLQTDFIEGRPTYVIAVEPKRKDKYLFEGRIWVDGLDYAVVRCEGKPARNPSFWTRSIQFVHQYQKTSDFWFPNTTKSVTDARIFGKTDVVIHYFDYAPNTFVERNAATPQHPSFHEANYVAKH
jgi:hypothetical protein